MFQPSRRACALFAIVLAAAATAQAGSVSLATRGDVVTLENDYLALTVDPQTGGRIVSLIHKRTGADLTPPRTDTTPGGMLADGVWSQNYWRSDWTSKPYKLDILDRGPDIARIALSREGNRWRGVTIAKQIALHAGHAAVDIDYTFTFGDDVDTRLLPDFHFHQAIAGNGKAYLPTPQGPRAFPLGAPADSWSFEPTAGWGAFVRDDGTAVGATMSFEHLRALRSCHRDVNTLEWVWRAMRAEPGLTVQSPVRLAAFTGLSGVTGMSRAAAVQIDVEGNRATVNLAALQAIDEELTLRLRRLPDGDEQPIGSAAINLQPDTSHTATFDLPPIGDGTFIITAQLGDLLRCERPLVVGDPSAVYAMAPAAQRRPEAGRRRGVPIDLDFNSLAIATPHVKWAKPGALGRPRVLVLAPLGHARTAVELAQRFDLDITTTYLNDDLKPWSLGDGVVRTADLHAHQAEVFKRDYDAIILDGGWDILSGPSRKRLVEMVHGGTGLIVAGGVPIDLKDFVPMIGQGEAVTSQWSVPQGDQTNIAAGLPLDALPAMRMSQVRLHMPEDDLLDEPPLPLVAARGTLYAVEWFQGSGRVIQLNSGSLLTDSVERRGLPPMYPWWEYHYALLGRLIHRAAGVQSPAALTRVDCTRDRVSLRVEGTQATQADITLRDAFGETLHAASIDLGAQSELTVPTDIAGRYRFADVIVTGEDGVLAWGAGAVSPGPGRITRVTLDKPYYLPDDDAGLTVVTSAAPADSVIHAELRDASDRIVATAQGAMPLKLPLSNVIGPAFDVRVRLIAGDVVQDVAQPHSYIKRPWQYDKLRTFFWGGPSPEVRQPHQIFDHYRRLADVGMNANWGEKWPDGRGWAMDRLNMAFELPSTGMSFKGLRKQDRFAEPNPDAPPDSPGMVNTRGARAAYREQQDNEELFVGDPANAPGKGPHPHAPPPEHTGGGIGDPANIPKLHQKGAAKASAWHHRNLLLFGTADENEGPGPDVNFSEVALDAFRKWLADTQYASLDELNREWATDFAAWDDVMPMTESEIRAHGAATGCYGAWSDQRQFNKWSYATFAKSFVDGVQSVEPGALVGASGTQESLPYSGRDWSLLAPAYTALGAYGGTQTPEQDMFNPTLVRYPWNGYNKPNPRNRASGWFILNGRNHGFGIFVDGSYIDPDFTLNIDGRDLQAALVDLHNGAGQLLVDADVAWDDVYMFHSTASMHGAYITDDDPRAHRKSPSGLMRLLRDMGIAYRSVSGAQVVDGYLTSSGARVLLLPQSLAMSPAEAEAIRAWIKQGGVAIADFEPAIMNDHCRLLDGSQLAGSGVTVLGDGVFAEYNTLKSATLKDSTALPQWLQYRARFAKLFAGAGVTPRSQVRVGDEPASYAWTFNKHKGDLRYVTVMRDFYCMGHATDDYAATAHLGEPAHVYEMRTGSYLGRGDSVDLTMTEYTLRLYALLPYRVTAVNLTPQGKRVSVTIEATGSTGDHWLRVDVDRPDGTRAANYGGDVRAPGGEADVHIPFALNDPPGAWRIRVRDVATGVSASCSIDHQPR